jgi:hypothetical protein
MLIICSFYVIFSILMLSLSGIPTTDVRKRIFATWIRFCLLSGPYSRTKLQNWHCHCLRNFNCLRHCVSSSLLNFTYFSIFLILGLFYQFLFCNYETLYPKYIWNFLNLSVIVFSVNILEPLCSVRLNAIVFVFWTEILRLYSCVISCSKYIFL